jgi:hypothetical protein
MPEQPPADPMAKVKTELVAGEDIAFTTFVVPPAGAGGRGFIWVWALPLLALWNRRERRRARAESGRPLGIVLPRLGFLVLTDRRLLLWSMDKVGRRGRRRRIGTLLAQADRSEVVSVTNNSAGQGWRTCTLALVDGRELVLRVPAFKVEALVEAFAPAADHLT